MVDGARLYIPPGGDLPDGFEWADEPSETSPAAAGTDAPLYIPPGGNLPEGFSWDDSESPAEPEGVTFAQSFGRGIDLMQGMAFGALEAGGEAVGSSEIKRVGREGRERNIEEAGKAGPRARVSEIRDFGDFTQWLKETVGEQIPMMGPTAGGALAGAGLGAMTGPAAPVAVPIGAAIGAFIPSAVLGTGETQMAIKEIDPNTEAPGYAFVGGAAIGALDSVVPGKLGSALLRRFGKETAEEIAKRALSKPVKAEFIKRTAKGAGQGMAVEGLTEAIQEAISEVAAAGATGTELDIAKTREQMIEAGAAGAVMGGGFGAVTGAAQRPSGLPTTTAPPAPEEPSAAPAAPETAQQPVAPLPAQTPPGPVADSDAPQSGVPIPAGFEPLFDEDGTTQIGIVNMETGEARMDADEPTTSTPEEIAEARGNVEAAPSEAQKEAGNYKKGHIKYQGYDVTIETPEGGERTGVGPDGEPWSVTMPADYGYIKRTEAADGEQLDVYLGPDRAAERVFVADQIDPATGEFDEHKALLGFSSDADARAAYEAGFSDGSGADRLGALTPLSRDAFAQFVEEGDLKSALAYQGPVEPQPADQRPISLLAMAKKMGGMKDPGGDLASMGAVRQRPGLVNNATGASLDDLGLAAFEQGYFNERPTIQELLDRMGEELRGNKQYTQADQQAISDQESIAEQEDWVQQADLMGLEYAPDDTVEAIRSLVLVERNRLEQEADSISAEADATIADAWEAASEEERQAYEEAIEDIPFPDLAPATEPAAGTSVVETGEPSQAGPRDEGGDTESPRAAAESDTATAEGDALDIPDFLRRKRQFRPAEEASRATPQREATEQPAQGAEESQPQPARANLADQEITYEVEVAETGEVVKVSENAQTALDSAQKRVDTLEALQRCLG